MSNIIPPNNHVRRLVPLLHYLRPYRFHVVAATLAIIITSTAVLGMGGGLRYLIDEGLSKGNMAVLDRAFSFLIGITLLLAVATYTRFYLVSWIGERVIADIRNDAYRRIIVMHIGFFETTRIGELLSRLTTDTTLLQTMIGSSVSIAIRNALLLVGGSALLLITSMHLTGYIALMVPLVVAPIIMLGRRVRRLGREAQNRVAALSTHAEETLSAIRTVQSLTLEPYETSRFADLVADTLTAALSRIRLRAFLTALVIMLVFGAIVTVLWFGGKDVLAGRITAGDLSAFIFYSIIVAGSIGAISEVTTDLQRAAGAAERLSELLAMTPDIADPPHTTPANTAPLQGSVRFHDVTFSYPSRPQKQVLDHISLDIAPGETIAIVGPSGAGKSTIFQLLLRFYDPIGGTIFIDDEDIRQCPLRHLRSIIGIVPQDPTMFSGTAEENLRLGNLTATDEDIRNAAEAVGILEFLQKLPHGLHTHIGEKGIQLSGGQKQRIAIARALIRNPRILLLDEATSALDSENEHHIQKAMAEIMRNHTTFIIAHRLSTVIQAKRIILLNEGRIEAIGSHHELLGKSPLYTRLAELQFQTAA